MNQTKAEAQINMSLELNSHWYIPYLMPLQCSICFCLVQNISTLKGYNYALSRTLHTYCLWLVNMLFQ